MRRARGLQGLGHLVSLYRSCTSCTPHLHPQLPDSCTESCTAPTEPGSRPHDGADERGQHGVRAARIWSDHTPSAIR
jgi:hypothetical protein